MQALLPRGTNTQKLN